MIREYINELILENDENLKDLERQLNGLIEDQNCAQKWLETLQSEENVDKNIFSPRAADADLDKKIEEARKSIEKAKQDIEYVKSFMETHLKKRQEFKTLLTELDEMNSQINSRNTQEEYNKTGYDFLSDLYKKTDVCLDSLYNDRVRCKNELKSMKTMVKDAMNSFEK